MSNAVYAKVYGVKMVLLETRIRDRFFDYVKCVVEKESNIDYVYTTTFFESLIEKYKHSRKDPGRITMFFMDADVTDATYKMYRHIDTLIYIWLLRYLREKLHVVYYEVRNGECKYTIKLTRSGNVKMVKYSAHYTSVAANDRYALGEMIIYLLKRVRSMVAYSFVVQQKPPTITYWDSYTPAVYNASKTTKP